MRNFLAAVALVVAGTVASQQFKGGGAKPEESMNAPAPKPANADVSKSRAFPEDDVKGSQKYLIATVPDPVLSRLSLHFDRWIESLQRAAESSGYTFESQWIPWTVKQAEYVEPGVLVFSAGASRLAILLVGESAVTGVSGKQFERARVLAGGQLAGVVGPCFSGGFQSLKALLGKTNPKPRVATGSATNAEAIAAFRRAGFNITATVDSDDYAISAFRSYLELRRVRFIRSAVLAEGDTTYGKTDSGESLHVTFPRDISVLRGAYESDQRLRRTLAQSADALVSNPNVALSRSEDLNAGGESVPSQSPVATAATQELAMNAVARRLAEDRVAMANVLATNSLDILFLRQFMDSRVPDMQFYILEPDILFTHFPESNAFQGTLALSRYPLFIPAGQGRIVAFPSKSAEGVYWAARSLLGGSGGISRYLWLSMVGIGGYWPIVPIPAENAPECVPPGCDPATGDPANWKIHPSKVYLAIWAAVAAALLAIFAASVRGWWALKKGEAPRRWFADFYFDPEAPLMFARRYHAYAMTVSLIALLMVLSRPLGTTESVQGWVYVGVLLVLPVLWFCRPVSARSQKGACGSWCNPRMVRLDSDLTTALATLVTLGVLTFMIIYYYWIWGPGGDPSWARFAAYRSMYLGNGVNPTLPLFLAGLAIASCAWFHFQRFTWASERFVPLNLKGFGTLGGPYERVRDILSRYSTLAASIAAVVTCAFIVLVAVNYGSALSVEGADYDQFLIAVLAVAGALTVLSMVQFLQTWWNLNDFLRGVESLPVRRVFDRLPRDLGSVAIFKATGRSESYLYLIKARDLLRQMKWMPREIRDRVDAAVHVLEVNAGADRRDKGAEIVEAEESLMEANAYLLKALQDELWSRGESELEPAKRQPHEELAEEFVAFRLLGFIRYAMLQLRNLLTYFSVAFILLSMSVSSYPFLSQSLSRMYIGISFVLLAGSSGYVLLGMARNRTLQRLSADAKGKDHPVFFQALQTASLPLLAFAGTYFPELGRVLFSWVQPTLSSIK